MRYPAEVGILSSEAVVDQSAEKVEVAKSAYTSPTLTPLGNVADLLSGAVGSQDDFGEPQAFTP